MSYLISYTKIKNQLISLLFIVSTLSFSWTPLVFILPVVLIFSSIRVFYLKFSLNYIAILVALILIYKSLPTQIIYIEWVRSILIACLIPTLYFGFYKLKYSSYYKILRVVYVSSVIVVLYIMIIEVPKDLNLFFGERRGFSAREYLLFGRAFPFSLGVTHLNVYINYIFTFLFIGLIEGVRKKRTLFLIILFSLIAISTDSRSPILYLIIMVIFYKNYISKITKKNILRRVKYFFIFLIGFLVLIFSYSYIIQIVTSSDRLVDFSRLIFFAKGFEHMMAEPWGNSLLYTDNTMPLLNYHNTFLAFGNRIGFWFFVAIIISFIVSLYYTFQIKAMKIKYTFLLLLYFCFHTYMTEDIIKFDFFVLILQFSILPFLMFNNFNLNEQEKS